MWVGVPVLDIGERGHHHLHKSDPSRDLSSGLGLRLWGRQLLNLMIDGRLRTGVARWGIGLKLIRPMILSEGSCRVESARDSL